MAGECIVSPPSLGTSSCRASAERPSTGLTPRPASVIAYAMEWRRPWAYRVQLVVVFAAYFVLARLGLRFDAVSGVATTVWPPTGIALAAFLLYGSRLW